MTRQRHLPFASSSVHLTRSLPLTVLTLLFALTALPFAVVAQSATATLSGTVVDQNSAVVPAVEITIVNIGTSLQRHATTNSEGYFTVPLLPPGSYSVTAKHEGFYAVQIPNLVLNVGDEKSLKIDLKVGDVKEVVNVTGETPLINESPAVGTVVDRQFVGNLPLNGRSFQSLISLTPGVVATKTSVSNAGQFSVNGQRANANYFMVDGVSANIGVNPGSSSGQATAGTLPAVGATGGTNTLVSVDALQEFRIQTSTYAAEFGRTPGAQVQIVTRSGTNEFHGSVFEYFRNDALDATDWFANANRLGKAALRQNDFGGVLGGRIIKDRTFFFFSYEGLRLRLPQTALTTVPSLTARQTASPAIQTYVNAFPSPNGKNLANNLSEFSSTYSDPSNLNASSIRIDHTVNARLNLFARYNHSPSESTSRGGGGRGLSNLLHSRFRTETLTGGLTSMITSHVTNEFRINYSRNKGASVFFIDNFGGAVPPSDTALFPSSVLSQDRLFGITIVAGTSARLLQGNFETDTERQINLVDSLNIVFGGQQLKFGVDYRRLFPIVQSYQYGQNTVFSDVNTLLAGRVTSASVEAFTGKLFPVFTNLSLFGQDTWRLTPRLVLTYGLRWELNPPPFEAKGNNPITVIGLNDPATITLAPSGTPLYKDRHNNFAPRFGVAYQVSSIRGKETTLKGGFGIFYDLGTGPAASAFGLSFPNRIAKSFSNVAFPLDSSQTTPPSLTSFAPPFGTIRGVLDPDLKLPYIYQWNFTVEQSLGRDQLVSATYLGAVGRRLLRQEVLSRPNANFTTLFVTRNTGTSDYHALQLQFQRRLARGLQALASYTWSHSLDNVSAESTFEAPVGKIDPRQERGPSDFDVRHAFSLGSTYNIPSPSKRKIVTALFRDYSMDAVFTARTATPVNLVTGAAGAGGLAGVSSISRPDLVLGVPLYINDPTVAGGRLINKAAFVTPVGRQGTLGRNALRGFGMWQLDLAFRRQFKLTEKIYLQFRSEFFNIFNHPNFGDPGANLNSTNVLTNALFGRSTQMLGRSLGSGGSSGGFNPLYQVGGPRSIQFVLRLGF